MSNRTGRERNEELGDFTTTWRVVPISLLAMGIGVLCAYVALALLRLIGLFTNLFYFGRWSTVDPLELLCVREVMEKTIVALPESAKLQEVMNSLEWQQWQGQRLLPLVDSNERLAGVLPMSRIQNSMAEGQDGLGLKALGELAKTDVVKTYPDESLRPLVYRMAESGVTRLPVVERGNGKLLGLVTLDDLLKARTRHMEEERRRERVLTWRFFTGKRPEFVETEP